MASREDACKCRECDAPAVPLQELEADTDLSYDKLISLHTSDCLLADTLEDLIRQKHHIRILASPALTVPASGSPFWAAVWAQVRAMARRGEGRAKVLVMCSGGRSRDIAAWGKWLALGVQHRTHRIPLGSIQPIVKAPQSSGTPSYPAIAAIHR